MQAMNNGSDTADDAVWNNILKGDLIMKKVLALILALVLTLGATSALADDVAAELGEGAVALDAAGLAVDGTEPVDATFGFATQLEEGKNYKALVSCFNADKSIAAQFVLPVVNENGKAKVQFTKEVLEAMNAAASNSITIFEVK